MKWYKFNVTAEKFREINNGQLQHLEELNSKPEEIEADRIWLLYSSKTAPETTLYLRSNFDDIVEDFSKLIGVPEKLDAAPTEDLTGLYSYIPDNTEFKGSVFPASNL